MADRREDAKRRLSDLSSRAKRSSQGMDVASIVEAVIGAIPERELIDLVEAAFQSNGSNPMRESEMVEGILALSEWKEENR
ncbi:MAG: hypothetical protein CL992_01415 [Euryarchaeota archaeon]|nr:hypothetical protein [Euryarchaeota archaeon]